MLHWAVLLHMIRNPSLKHAPDRTLCIYIWSPQIHLTMGKRTKCTKWINEWMGVRSAQHTGNLISCLHLRLQWREVLYQFPKWYQRRNTKFQFLFSTTGESNLHSWLTLFLVSCNLRTQKESNPGGKPWWELQASKAWPSYQVWK